MLIKSVLLDALEARYQSQIAEADAKFAGCNPWKDFSTPAPVCSMEQKNARSHPLNLLLKGLHLLGLKQSK